MTSSSDSSSGAQADGKPVAMITPADGRGWFWIQAGTCVGGKLYLFLVQIERAGDGVFGFRQAAQWLGVVANSLDEPERWKVEQKRIPFTDFSGKRRLSFGAATLRNGDHVFIYGTDERQGDPGLPDKQMIVARVAADSLGDFDAWRFYRDGRWIADFRQAGHLAGGMGNDYSVSFRVGLKRYVAVYTHLGMSDQIMARAAETPWGPMVGADRHLPMPRDEVGQTCLLLRRQGPRRGVVGRRDPRQLRGQLVRLLACGAGCPPVLAPLRPRAMARSLNCRILPLSARRGCMRSLVRASNST